MMEEAKVGEVEFNLAKWLNMEMARLISEANRAFVSRNYSKAVDCQIAKRFTAGFTLSEKERRELDNMEDQFAILIAQESAKDSFNPDAMKKGQDAYVQLRKLYRDYVVKLNDLLDRDGWYGARKKDATKMKWM